MKPTKKAARDVARQRFESLVACLRRHATERPEHTALVFLPDGETEVGRLTYSELDRRARAFAARLQGEGLAGKAVLLMLPSSIYYVVAFLGSLYAKAIPVPAYPPSNSMHAERVAQIVKDCDAKGVILTTTSSADNIRARLEQVLPDGVNCAFMPIDDASGTHEDNWRWPDLNCDDLAFLQYTSGSTSQPRGVMVTHGNLMRHCQSWQAAARQDQADVFVSWLPLFHDMGLIGSVIQPLYLGATIVLMPSMAFLQKPMRWLAAISRYRGTAGFAPNFAYELCAATLDEGMKATLDLSSWRIALNGAEPVNADTLTRFARRFASCGFQSAALNPAYGLAEATLVVTMRAKLEAAHICDVDAMALSAGKLVPAEAQSGNTRALVSCGRVWSGVQVAVVDPAHCVACPDGSVGEVWVRGPTVASGYWQRPQETTERFQAFLDSGEGPFLRTGDLGVLWRGELYITGRIKDLIIIRGQNHYPQDIELSVFRAHPALGIGHGAAFSVEIDGEERLVVVQEIRRSRRKHFDGAEVVEAIRAVITEQHGLAPHAVVLLGPATVPLTSSGKIQRQTCKADYLGGRFEVLHEWQDGAEAGGPLARVVQEPPAAGRDTAQAIADWLAAAIMRKKNLRHDQLAHDSPFLNFHLDSLDMVALSGELSVWLERTVEPAALYDFPDIGRLARHLAGLPAVGSAQSAPARPDTAPARLDTAAGTAAILGMACRLPGADSLDTYWQLLESGTDAIAEVPAARRAVTACGQAGTQQPGKTSSRWGGFISGADQFDARFFGISPREAQSMDPQQRILLETAWHALEDAGIPPDMLAGSRTGVFIGISSTDYRELQLAQHAGTDAWAGTGNAMSIAANRLSYFFDLRGPSLAIDTACSSSLVALHQARLSLYRGECDLAIVGGVNLILSPGNTIIFSQAQMMASDGRCKTFDASADGYVRAEGCGVLILQRHADALSGGKRIQALLPGSAVNQDGRSNGLTAPNGVAQQDVIRQALRAAGKTAAQVSYVEAHGTGTRLGDPIEVGALRQVYGAPEAGAGPLWVGSVKTNIGHLEAAAGIAGLIKTVLMLRHRRIPPHLHLQQLNPLIALDGSRIVIPTATQAWESDREGTHVARVAGVSSFGFGGTNAHVIVQEASPHPAQPASQVEDGAPLQVLCLSARDPESLRALAARHAAMLEADCAGTAFAAFCLAANTRRSLHPCRLALAAASGARMATLLRRFGLGEEAPQIRSGFAAGTAAAGKTAFLFSGQGTQAAGMGRGLYLGHAGFRKRMDQCDAIVQTQQGWSLLALLYGDDKAEAEATPDRDQTLQQTCYAQPALFALEYALAGVWQSAGIRPDYLIGHSLGEYVAACVAGVFSLEHGLQLVGMRGRLMQDRSAPGVMYAVRGPAELISRVLDAAPSRVFSHLAIAAHNSCEELVLSGGQTHVEEMASHLVENGAIATRLQVTRAFHSPMMRGLLEEFSRCAQAIDYFPPAIPLVSNLTGQFAGPEIATAGYWVRHIEATVQFARGLETLGQAGCTRFIELGPHPVLSGFARATLTAGLCLHSLRRGRDDEAELADALAQWQVNGGAIDWLLHEQARRGAAALEVEPIDLPLYPFRRDAHWFVPGVAASAAVPTVAGLADAGWPGRRIALGDDGLACFETILPGSADFLRDHRVRGRAILPGAACITLALGAARQAGIIQAGALLRMRAVRFLRPLDLSAGATQVQTILRREGAHWEVRFAARAIEADALPDAARDGAPGTWAIIASAILEPVADGTILAAAENGGCAACGDAGQADCLDTDKSGGACSGPESESSRNIDVAGCYRFWSERGLDYGASFQAIRVLRQDSGSAAAMVSLPPGIADPAPGSLHPVLLDAAFQTLAVLLREQAATLDCMPVPARIDAILLHARAGGELRVKAHLRACDDHEALADIFISDAAGRPVADLRGMAFAWINTHAGRASDRAEPVETAYLLPVWSDIAPACPSSEFSSSASPAVPALPATVLLVYSPSAENFARTLAACHAGARCCMVCLATATVCKGPDTWEINGADPAAFNTVLAQTSGFDRVYFLGGLVRPEANTAALVADSDYAYLAQHQEHGLISLFRLLQALRRSAQPGLTLKAMTNGACAVLADEDVLPWSAGIGGLLQCAAREYPDWTFAHLDIGSRDEWDGAAAPQLAAAFAAQTVPHQVMRAGRRLQRRLQRIEPAAPVQTSFREGGVYLIVGGTGGIGFALARLLAQQLRARLALVGRAPPGAAQQQKIDELHALGGSAIYVQADLTQAAAMQAAVQQVKARFGELHGAIHSALVLQDKTLDNMDEALLRGVLAPKVQGSVNLYQALAQEPLDFLLLFSSVQSFLCSAGQANYVAANQFQDAFAHALRRAPFPVKVINWGYWGEVGVAADGQLGERMQRLGLGSISASEGLAALQALLRAPARQMVFIKAGRRFLTKLQDEVPGALQNQNGGDDASADALARLPAPAAAPGLPATDAMLAPAELLQLPSEAAARAILTSLAQMAGAVFRIDLAHIHTDGGQLAATRLSVLGIDSLMAMELRNQLRAWAGVDLPTHVLIGGASLAEVARLIHEKLLMQQIGTPTGSASPGKESDMEEFVL